jgi:hypothetical protein
MCVKAIVDEAPDTKWHNIVTLILMCKLVTMFAEQRKHACLYNNAMNKVQYLATCYTDNGECCHKVSHLAAAIDTLYSNAYSNWLHQNKAKYDARVVYTQQFLYRHHVILVCIMLVIRQWHGYTNVLAMRCVWSKFIMHTDTKCISAYTMIALIWYVNAYGSNFSNSLNV